MLKRRVKVEDDEDAESDVKPTFGASLDRFRAAATPTRSPSRQSRRISEKRSRSSRSSSTTSSPANHVLKREEALGLGDNPFILGQSVDKDANERAPVASTRKLKLQASDEVEGSAISTALNTPKTPKKRKVQDVGQYEGMSGIPDRLAHDLDILFCGINPGVKSSQEGYHYAHPSNRFYRILYESGLTPHKLKPSESPDMPSKYKLGLTDLVPRCTARADMVPALEFQAGATGLLRKLVEYKPKMVCFVGMDVYRNFRRHFASIPSVLPSSSSSKKPGSPATTPGSHLRSPTKAKKSSSDVQVGLQNLTISTQANIISSEKSEDANTGISPHRELVRLFVIPSTSGLAAGYSDADRIAYLKEAKEIISAIRARSDSRSSVAEMEEDTVIVQAEDFMQERIVKLANGKWASVA